MPRYLGNRTFDGNITFSGNVYGVGISQLLDGYTISTGSTGDGYVAFFTGTNIIAGDNDLFWDRANNRLGIHTTTPTVELDIVGNLKVSNNLQFGSNAILSSPDPYKMAILDSGGSAQGSLELATLDAYGSVNIHSPNSKYIGIQYNTSAPVIYKSAETTDTAPESLLIHGGAADGYATGTNRYGGELILTPPLPTHVFTMVTNLAGAVTAYVKANSTSYSFASGTAWILGTDDTATQLAVSMNNLANAINATATLNTLVTAIATGANVYVEAIVPGCRTVSISTSVSARLKYTDGPTAGNTGKIRLGLSGSYPNGTTSDSFILKHSSWVGNLVVAGDANTAYANLECAGIWFPSTFGIPDYGNGCKLQDTLLQAKTTALFSIASARSSTGNDNFRMYAACNAAGEHNVVMGTSVADADGGSLSTLLALATDVDGTAEYKHMFYGSGEYDAYGGGQIKVHSNSTDLSRYIGITHDGTDGYIHSDFGNIKLSSATGKTIITNPAGTLSLTLQSDAIYMGTAPTAYVGMNGANIALTYGSTRCGINANGYFYTNSTGIWIGDYAGFRTGVAPLSGLRLTTSTDLTAVVPLQFGNKAVITSPDPYKIQILDSGGSARGSLELNTLDAYGILNVHNTTDDNASTTSTYIRCYAGAAGTTDVGGISNVVGTLQVVQESDENYKSNISPTQVNGLEIINNIDLIEYQLDRYIDSEPDHKIPIGFSAQNLQKAYPNAVYENDTGKLMVAPGTLLPVLIKAIQEQQKQIEELKEQIKK